jgi:predicted nucleotidyltransferase
MDLSADYLTIVRAILAKHVPDAEVRVFGSRATHNAKAHSDLDLAILGREKTAENSLANLKAAFDETDLPFRVDVVDWRSLPESFVKLLDGGYDVIQRPRDET